MMLETLLVQTDANMSASNSQITQIMRIQD